MDPWDPPQFRGTLSEKLFSMFTTNILLERYHSNHFVASLENPYISFCLLVSCDLYCQKNSVNHLSSFQSINLHHIPLLPYLPNTRGKNMWRENFKNLIEICMKYCF